MVFHPGIIKDVFIQAVYSLTDNKLRTILSILGIAIGIAAVMTVGSVTQGVRDYVYTELQTYGLKTIWIYRNWQDDTPNRAVRQGSGINLEDLKTIQSGCCPAVLRATPVVYSKKYTMPINEGNSHYKAPVEGVGLEYFEINKDHLSAGRTFRKDDLIRRKEVAVIGRKVAEALYGKSGRYVGQSFRLYKKKFTVIGVLSDKSRDILNQIGADSYDINGRVIIPYTVYQTILGSKNVHTLQAEAVSMDKTGDAMRQIEDMLHRSHGGRFKYTKESMDGWIATAEEVLGSITTIGLLGASISLLVGGMGIMNIMSTSVVERTREIGVRKAIGAQNQDILIQFLMESTYISTIGGFIGLLLGIVAVIAISLISGYRLPPSLSMGVVAILVSLLVGVISGFYPAYRASNLRPVDALRFE